MGKKTIAGMAAVIMLLCLMNIPVNAMDKVVAEIPIEIEGGGTATITAQVNCPLPDFSSVKVANGMTKKVKITFTEPGDYSYIIKVVNKEKIYYSPTYYDAKVAVRVNDDDSLSTVTVITGADGKVKTEDCRFIASAEPLEPDKPIVHEEPKKNPPTSRPKTGDDSQLDMYLFICIMASAALFLQSVYYYIETNRLIKCKP